jgi:hypothetical protein
MNRPLIERAGVRRFVAGDCSKVTIANFAIELFPEISIKIYPYGR